MLDSNVFGRLVVLYENGTNKEGDVLYKCACSCGKHTLLDVSSKDLISGEVVSCGCIDKDAFGKLNK